MSHRVVFTPEALDQIASLYQYIAVAASPGIALDYTEAIVSYCESLSLFPLRRTINTCPNSEAPRLKIQTPVRN